MPSVTSTLTLDRNPPAGCVVAGFPAPIVSNIAIIPTAGFHCLMPVSAAAGKKVYLVFLEGRPPCRPLSSAHPRPARRPALQIYCDAYIAICSLDQAPFAKTM